MNKEAAKHLADIQMAISNINSHLQGKLEFKMFQNNITIHSAIERELFIIGEAMTRLLKLFPEIKITDSKKIIGLRNKLAHEYDMIDDAQIWNIIVNFLPRLKQEVESLLKKYDSL